MWFPNLYRVKPVKATEGSKRGIWRRIKEKKKREEEMRKEREEEIRKEKQESDLSFKRDIIDRYHRGY